jgi:glycosyltransferase involved in cell wall biosynthesis
MRVLEVLPAYLPALDYGGPVIASARLFPLLVRRYGMEITVVTPNLERQGVVNTLPEREIIEGVEVIRLPVALQRRFSTWTVWREKAFKGRWDLVHLHGAWTGIVYQGFSFARRHHLPLIYSPHGMLVLAGRSAGVKALLIPFHLAIARYARFILGTSPVERASAPLSFRLFPWVYLPPSGPSLLEPPDPQTARDALSLPSSLRIFGYLGRIHPRKGILTILNAWRKAWVEGLLLFAGPPEDPGLVKEIEKTPRTRYLGTLPPEQVPLYLRALSALLLLPSYGENFGNVVVEAIAVGTPVLISPAVGARVWLEKNPGAIVLKNPERDLLSWFHRDLPTPSPLPDELTLDGIASRLVELYEGAIRTRG